MNLFWHKSIVNLLEAGDKFLGELIHVGQLSLNKVDL